MKDKYKAVVVGCGRIGAFFDDPNSTDFLTHAKGYYVHPRTALSGFYDVDVRKAEAAATVWGGAAFGSLRGMMEEVRPDFVSVCVPDALHYEVLRRIAEFSPALVLAEKPVTNDVGLSREIADLYMRNSIACNVNYSRRFDPFLQNLREEWKCGKFGDLIKASGIYGKGILHNGSHMVDFFRWFFGEVASFKPLGAVYDYSEDDPTVEFRLEFSEGGSAVALSGKRIEVHDFRNSSVFRKGEILLFSRWARRGRDRSIRRSRFLWLSGPDRKVANESGAKCCG